jgi:hypothetical protein
MARKHKKDSKGNNAMLPVMRPDAGGIDIGATEIFVAVPADRAAENVRSFPTFTQDLYALADWLKQCGVKTVAMESTGVYWIPLFQILTRLRLRPTSHALISPKAPLANRSTNVVNRFVT